MGLRTPNKGGELHFSLGRAAGFESMRCGLEMSFATSHKEPFLGRLSGPQGSPSVSWLTYAQVGARVRACAALLDALVLSTSCEPPPGASRPFVAIGGPNAVEWLVADLACSGTFLPSVGMHPDWPAANVAGALDLTCAPVLVLTSAALLPTIAEVEAAAAAAGAAGPLQHVLVLDPSVAAPGQVEASPAGAALKAQGIELWVAVGSEPGAPTPLTPLSALHGLALRALGGVPLTGAAQAAQWRELLEAAGADGAGGTSPSDGTSALRIFIEPTAEWLGSRAAAEEARELAARALPLAGSQSGSAAGPLYHPIADEKDVKLAESAGARTGHGGADWVVAAQQGSAEARFDLACLWSVVFATGSSGKLKATPYTRASWASASGCNSGGKELSAELGDNKTVLSHSAMSHGLDRGFYWKALLLGGSVGMARGHGFEEIREALSTFKPGLFCTMPSFWERLYFETCEGVREMLV
jgi:hypothetical protein